MAPLAPLLTKSLLFYCLNYQQTITTLNYLLICLHEVAHKKSCKKLFSEKKTNFFDFFLIISATWYFQKQITLLADNLTSKQRVKDSVGK